MSRLFFHTEIADYAQGATHFLTEKPTEPTGAVFYPWKNEALRRVSTFFHWKNQLNRREPLFFRGKSKLTDETTVFFVKKMDGIGGSLIFFGGKWEVIRVQGHFFAQQCKLSSHEPSFTTPKNPTNGL